MRMKKEAGLPNVVFHSLRYSSTTYKPNHGDLKATQGDTGHAETDMIKKIYAHILDEDRKINAQKFEASFYANPDLRTVRAPQEQKNFPQPQPTQDVSDFCCFSSRKKPGLVSSLAALIRG